MLILSRKYIGKTAKRISVFLIFCKQELSFIQQGVTPNLSYSSQNHSEMITLRLNKLGSKTKKPHH
jgi:hypothetical protein